MLQTVQIGINTADISGSLRLYSEAFGFRNAGAQAAWGSTIGVQGLGPDNRTLLWWMIGAQPYFQLELFHHATPAQRPMPPDWRPCDHGWVRFGVTVSDFDAAQDALTRFGAKPLNGVIEKAGQRRLAARDPFAGVIIEVIEGEPGGAYPRISYVTSSVSNLETARAFYEHTLGFKLDDLSVLHHPEDEELWGLAHAARDGFIVRTGPTLLEIVRYASPAGRPRPADYRISDQGIMNVALGSRNVQAVETAFTRMAEVGLKPPFKVLADDTVCGYITEAEREIEFVSTPESLNAALGFLPAADFLR
ncbi:MAG: VOC family protein [Caulobacterales bacterium]